MSKCALMCTFGHSVTADVMILQCWHYAHSEMIWHLERKCGLVSGFWPILPPDGKFCAIGCVLEDDFNICTGVHISTNFSNWCETVDLSCIWCGRTAWCGTEHTFGISCLKFAWYAHYWSVDDVGIATYGLLCTFSNILKSNANMWPGLHILTYFGITAQNLA